MGASMKTWMTVVTGLAVIAWLGVTGCAEQKAPPAPSQRQVQSDSDRFFDKVKQEEREQGKGPANGGY